MVGWNFAISNVWGGAEGNFEGVAGGQVGISDIRGVVGWSSGCSGPIFQSNIEIGRSWDRGKFSCFCLCQ